MQARMAVFATTMLCALCASALPEITSVNVRQQWPWSAKINVDFHLANDEATPVDVSLAVSNGNAAVSVPTHAVSGPRIGLSATGDYRLVIDSAKIGSGGPAVLGNFSVTLSLSATRADADFPLYKIYSLSDNTCTNVTVKALLNGEWGDVETDYSFAGGPYTPADVIIWTGVTNNPAYKTSLLVMRYAPAGTYTAFKQKSPPGVDMTLTEPFYVGVFEMTQGQCAILNSARATPYYSGSSDSAMRPMGSVSLTNMRGENSGKNWPDTSYTPAAVSYIGVLRTRTGNSSFDLPTCARWECAARAGCTNRWYNGVDAASGTEANAAARALCRNAGNGGLVDGTTIPAGNADSSSGTAVVGSYLPNAWGLYDCIGNVMEQCLDRATSVSSITSGGPYQDWPGPGDSDGVAVTYHAVRGGSYHHSVSSLQVDWYYQANFGNNYTSGASEYKDKDQIGFRVVCSASAAPYVSPAAAISVATASAVGSVSLAPDASPFWRTAKADAPIVISIDWPDGAVAATCTLTSCGGIAATHSVSRVASEPGTTFSLSLPVPNIPDDERVYEAELSFTDANEVAIAGATRRARFATVLGQDGGATVVRAAGTTGWTRFRGRHLALPIASGTSGIYIDGVAIDPGLDGAEGWYGAELSFGAHMMTSDMGSSAVYCAEPGMMIIAR